MTTSTDIQSQIAPLSTRRGELSARLSELTIRSEAVRLDRARHVAHASTPPQAQHDELRALNDEQSAIRDAIEALEAKIGPLEQQLGTARHREEADSAQAHVNESTAATAAARDRITKRLHSFVLTELVPLRQDFVKARDDAIVAHKRLGAVDPSRAANFWMDEGEIPELHILQALQAYAKCLPERGIRVGGGSGRS